MEVGEYCYRFLSGFPRTIKGFDSVWVVVEKLTKSTHFMSIKTGMTSEKLAEPYIDQIMRLHGVLVTIMSDRDT